MSTRPSPEVIRHVAREALAKPCACGQCPDDAALQAVIDMTDTEILEHMDTMAAMGWMPWS